MDLGALVIALLLTAAAYPAPNPEPPTPSLESRAPGAIFRRPDSAAEVLELFDVDESLLRQLIDHRPLAEDEEEAIVRVLLALPNIPAQDVERWSETEPDWDAVIASPEQHRTKIFRLQGYATRVERIPLVSEAAERFGFSHYYRAAVELGEDRWRSVVCARDVPAAWKLGEPMREAVSFYGMFLKLGDRPVFATRRLAWHPNRLDEETGISKDHVFLGDLGMDVGLWDEVRDRQPLLSDDRECFYQLLAAMGRTQQEHVRARAAAQWDFARLLRRPADYRGRLLRVEGTARRATRIEVNDPDIQARFGIDHYYEVSVIVHLDTMIVYKKEDGETLKYNRFPVVCALRELPPGMPTGDDIRQRVSIPAVFFKVWAYHAAKMSRFNEAQSQHCPMLVGVAPDVHRSETVYNPYIGAAAGGLFIAALLGVWIGVWRFNVEDARFERQTLKRQYELEEGKSLNNMGLEAKDAPDFSHLE